MSARVPGRRLRVRLIILSARRALRVLRERQRDSRLRGVIRYGIVDARAAFVCRYDALMPDAARYVRCGANKRRDMSSIGSRGGGAPCGRLWRRVTMRGALRDIVSETRCARRDVERYSMRAARDAPQRVSALVDDVIRRDARLRVLRHAAQLRYRVCALRDDADIRCYVVVERESGRVCCCCYENNAAQCLPPPTTAVASLVRHDMFFEKMFAVDEI